MDHVPLVNDPALSRLEVPYVCEQDCDGVDFFTYPLERGFTLQVLQQKSWVPARLRVQQMLPFMQEWLYFGVLAHVFDVPMYMIKQDFIALNRNGKPIVTTAKLPAYISTFADSVRAMPVALRRKRLEATRLFLSRATGYCQFELEQFDSLGLLVKLSIVILFHTLKATRHALMKESGAEAVLTSGDTGELAWSRFVQNRLLEAGWCRSEIIHRRNLFSTWTMHYASFIRRRATRSDHLKCSSQECIAENIDNDTYRTQHVTKTCSCQFAGPDRASVNTILSSGGIPVIEMVADSDHIVSLEVRRQEPEHPYIAISHVWAHGLGNAISNSLPLCQLLRLNRLIASLDRDTPHGSGTGGTTSQPSDAFDSSPGLKVSRFWIDTLCVPNGRDEVHLRKAAIASMGKTYSRAGQVLVLDQEVEQATCRASTEECLVRLCCSAWARRCWTLQEAFLAQKLYIQFRDDVWDIEAHCSRKTAPPVIIGGMTTRYSGLYNTTFKEAVKFYNTLMSLREFDASAHSLELEDETASSRFVAAWKAMVGRTTSKPDDRIIIFAQILGLDLAIILAYPPPQRAKAVLTMQKYLPLSQLTKAIPRMAGEDFNWAPDLKATIELGIPTPSFISTVDAHGLSVTCPGFIVAGSGSTGLVGSFFIIPSDQTMYDVFIDDVVLGRCHAPQTYLHACLLCSSPLWQRELTASSSKATMLALVFMESVDGNTFRTVYGAPAEIRHMQPEREAIIRSRPQDGSEVYTKPVLSAKRTTDYQHWHIR